MGLWDWFIEKTEKKRIFNKEKYLKIIKNLIKKSYPSLKNKPLIVRELKKSRLTASTRPIKNKIIIYISPRMDTYSISLNEGILAHELGHMIDWCSRSWFDFHILRDYRNLFIKYRKEEEIRADKIAIQRGYTKPLYIQRKKRFESKNPKDIKIFKLYWSHNEIKNYAKFIGKWK